MKIVDKGSLNLAFDRVLGAASMGHRRLLDGSSVNYVVGRGAPQADLSHVGALLSGTNMHKLEVKNLY